MIIGLDIYSAYGIHHSKLEPGIKLRKGNSVLNGLGLTLSVFCFITGLWHQQTAGWSSDKTLLVIAFAFGVAHFAFYMVRIYRMASEKA